MDTRSSISKPDDFDVELEFGGQPVTMVPFVEQVIKNVVLGLARPMRGYTEGTDIKIVLKHK